MKRLPILSPEQGLAIIDSYSIIKALAKMIDVQWHYYPDADLKSPVIHNHVKRILESATAIQAQTGSIIGVKAGSEDKGNNHAYELLRALKFLLDNFDAATLKIFNDKSVELLPEVSLEAPLQGN